ALEVGDRLDRRILRHHDAVNVALVSRVEIERLDALRADDCERLDRGHRIIDVLGGDRLHAIGRTRQRHQLHLDAGLREPAHFGGNGIGRRRRSDGLSAPADADRGLRGGGRKPGRKRSERHKRDCSFHVVPPFLTLAPSICSFCETSQNSTRRRIAVTMPLSAKPSADRISSTENCPATSMVKFMLWISMPRPDSAPTSSATMAPSSEKIMAISSPAKM